MSQTEIEQYLQGTHAPWTGSLNLQTSPFTYSPPQTPSLPQRIRNTIASRLQQITMDREARIKRETMDISLYERLTDIAIRTISVEIASTMNLAVIQAVDLIISPALVYLNMFPPKPAPLSPVLTRSPYQRLPKIIRDIIQTQVTNGPPAEPPSTINDLINDAFDTFTP